MTLLDIKKIYQTSLQKIYSIGETEAITKLAIEYYTGLSKNDSISNLNEELPQDLEKKLLNCLEELNLSKPIQQIIGECWFYNYKFLVNEYVLIPRSETEELVYEAIQHINKNDVKNLIDIGTGSGCIPISIKKNISHLQIDAIDISEDALMLARKNAKLLDTQINFINLDFLEEKNYEQLTKYDLIISNPPYIADNEILEKNVLNFEPHLALFVPKNDALLFYKKILIFADEHLAENGKIMLEVNEKLAKETAQLFLDKNYVAEIKLDIQGKERMVIISKQNPKS